MKRIIILFFIFVHFAFGADKTYRADQYQLGKIGFVETITGKPLHGEAIKIYYMHVLEDGSENLRSNHYCIGNYDNGKRVGIHISYWQDKPYKVESYNKGVLVSEQNLLDKYYIIDTEKNYVIVNKLGKISLVGYREKTFGSSDLIQNIYYNTDKKNMILMLKDTFYMYCNLSEEIIEEWIKYQSREEYYYKNIKGKYSCK